MSKDGLMCLVAGVFAAVLVNKVVCSKAQVPRYVGTGLLVGGW